MTAYAQNSQTGAWTTTGSTARFEVADYGAAMGLTVQIGLEAQRRNHHPEITVGWGSVVVSLVTHDADNAVTDKDVDLAAWIDQTIGGDDA